MAKKGNKEKLVKITFFVLLIATVVLLISKYVEFDERTTYEKTLDRITKLDKKYTTSIDDYKYGMDYLRYHPRYPKPLNPGDIPDVVEEFEKIRDDFKRDRPSFLLVDARIHLFEAEKYYKLSKKYPLKGAVEDGFNCGDMETIIEAVINLNLSVHHGRIAMNDLKEFYENYKEKAEVLDISKFWVKSVNKTFDEVAERAKKNENTINYFCLEGEELDDELEDEFVQARDIMGEG